MASADVYLGGIETTNGEKMDSKSNQETRRTKKATRCKARKANPQEEDSCGCQEKRKARAARTASADSWKDEERLIVGN